MKKANKLGLTLLLSACLLTGGLSLGNNPSVAIAEESTGVNEAIKANCQKALDLLSLNIDEDGVVSDMLLPVSSLYSTTLSWVSSNEDALKVTAIENSETKSVTGYRGVVTRGSEDVKVDLTVTAQIGDNVASTASKTYSLTILKQGASSGSELPSSIDEDFSAYEPGVDLSNYSLWNQAVGDAQISSVIDEADFPNNIAGERALKITSGRQTSDVRYDRGISLKRATENHYVLSGYYLYMGETNEVSLEIAAQGTVKAGIALSHEGLKVYGANGYAFPSGYNAEGLIKEGVWLRFRLDFRLSAWSFAETWDWKSNSYYTMSEDEYGSSTGTALDRETGEADTLRIKVSKGTSVGASYLAGLKLDTFANQPKETSIENPNRDEGISIIGGYQETILAFTGETPEGIDPSGFQVHNRFNEEQVYTEDTDYTITTTMDPASGVGDVVTYTHDFELVRTGESKVVTQTVYYDDRANPAKFSSYHASYLKKAVVSEGETATNPNAAYLTLSGEVVRNDITLHYLILEKDSTAPTAAQVEGNDATVSGYALGGSYQITSHEWSLDTDSSLDLTKEYDVYLLGKNANGSTEVLKVPAISTVVNISTCDEFYDMTTNLNTVDSEFRLLNDLDFTGYDWQFTQNNSVKFGGILDGQGHTISNLSIFSTEGKVGLFTRVEEGTIKNITFKDCEVYGYYDVGIISGETYGGTFSDIRFEGCSVGIEQTMTGGDGYFGILTGRCRGDSKVVDMDNIVIKDASVVCPKYCGLLTGGLEKTVQTTIDNIEASGTIDTEGAAVGLIGRNRGKTTIEGGLCFLEVEYAKKEIGIVAGHNKEGGSLSVKDFFGDLKIKNMTQPTYFGQLIGSHDSNTSSFSIDHFSYAVNDYSNLSDSIVPDTKTVTVGTSITMPTTVEGWEQNTFIRDFNTSLSWQYDEASQRPCLDVRSSSEIAVTAEMFAEYVGKLKSDPAGNHYYLYKAGNVYEALSEAEKAKVSAADKSKYDEALAAYNALHEEIEDATGGLGYRG